MTDPPRKGETWRFRDSGGVYKIVSVATAKRGPTFPPGDLVRGRRIPGGEIIWGKSWSWQKFAEKV